MTCVSIGFCISGHPVMGVIYAPVTNEWYLAVKGHGAYRNGIRILQQSSRSTKSIEQAVICCEFGYSRDQKEIDAMLGAVSRILGRGCRAIRQLGSGCLDLCYVATGRLDIVYAGIANEGWKPWDYAAALVVCQEAGCVMESIDQPTPGGFDLYSKSVLCGVSRTLVNDCRRLLRPDLGV
jgi:fructose-1,6-bisphosphatase/inositol monophosphatase family enzyme